MKTESQQMSSVQTQYHEEVQAVKRRRESISLEEIPDVNRLLNSLNESHNLVKKFKENNAFIDNKNSKTVKEILEKMLNVWAAGDL